MDLVRPHLRGHIQRGNSPSPNPLAPAGTVTRYTTAIPLAPVKVRRHFDYGISPYLMLGYVAKRSKCLHSSLLPKGMDKWHTHHGHRVGTVWGWGVGVLGVLAPWRMEYGKRQI